MKSRTFMLVYVADDSIRDMTLTAVSRFMASTGAHDALTVAFNGPDTFVLPESERLTVVALGERLGIAKAFNSLVNAASEPFIGFLHNDCLVPETPWLGEMTEWATSNGFAFPVIEVGDAQARGVAPAYAAIPPSCCYVMTRDAWTTLGGFDEGYEGVHFEDTDLFMRAIRAGYRLARVPSVNVFHHRGVTRAMVADESNECFLRNQARYVARWQVGVRTPLPCLQ